ncbi:MAG: hypothetical protein ACRCZI_15465 [Cetobacterium sp.]
MIDSNMNECEHCNYYGTIRIVTPRSVIPGYIYNNSFTIKLSINTVHGK